MLASPGFMAAVEGTVGIDGINSDIDVGFKDLFNKIDMIWATRAEAGRRRVLEGERGFLDLLAGVRYTSLYQHLHLQSDNAGIADESEHFVDRASDVIRDRLNDVLSENNFRNALASAVDDRIGSRLDDAIGADPRRQNLPIGPVGGRPPKRVTTLVEEAVRGAEADLRAEIDALKLSGAARAAEVERRVGAAKSKLEKKVSVGRSMPDAFAFGTGTDRTMNGFNAFYFSFVTLSTVGFGDVTPVSKLARTLAVMEAVCGTFFITVLIARVVAMYSLPRVEPSDISSSP